MGSGRRAGSHGSGGFGFDGKGRSRGFGLGFGLAWIMLNLRLVVPNTTARAGEKCRSAAAGDLLTVAKRVLNRNFDSHTSRANA